MRLKYYNFFFAIFFLAKNIFPEKEVLNIFIHGIAAEWSCKKNALKYFFTLPHTKKITSIQDNTLFKKKGLLGIYRFLSETIIDTTYEDFLPQKNNSLNKNNYFFIWGKNEKSPGIWSKAGYREAADALLEYIEEYCTNKKIEKSNLELNFCVHSHGGQVMEQFLYKLKKENKFFIENLFFYESAKTKKLEDAIHFKCNDNYLAKNIIDINGEHSENFHIHDFTAQFPFCFKRFLKKRQNLKEFSICLKIDSNCKCDHMLPHYLTFKELKDLFQEKSQFLQLKKRASTRLENINKALQWTIYYQKWIYLFFICYLKKNTIKIKFEQLKRRCKIFQSSLPQ